MRSSADLHAGDLDLGEILPVPGLATVAGAPRKPENPDLLVFTVAHDFGRNLGALHHRRTGLDVFTVAGDEDAVERHLSTRLRIQQRDLDRDARFGAELSATRGENGVGHTGRNLNRDNRLVKSGHGKRETGHGTATFPVSRLTFPDSCQATAYCSVTSRPAGLAIIRNSSSLIIGSSRTSSSKPVCFSSCRRKFGSCSTR